MWRAERYQRIQALLETFGQVSIERLTSELAVSRETVRRDVKNLEAAGRLRRVHGGIVPMSDPSEAPYKERALQNLNEKRSIAAACCAKVSAGQALLIDAGSTTALLAQALARLSGLTVFTNSFAIAAELGTEASRQRQNRVVLLGGDYCDQPPSTTGPMLLEQIARIQADLAICSPFGFTTADGAASYSFDEAQIARAMLSRARQRIVLADHSKLGIRGRLVFAPPEEIDLLITDAAAASHADFAPLRELMGARLVCAG